MEKVEKNLLVCSNCKKKFNINDIDDSGYVDEKPYCNECRNEILDFYH